MHVFEHARELGELGVGINLLPHATKALATLGLLPALDEAGIRTEELVYANRFGQVVWQEPRGTAAGYDVPQFSIHRGRLHGLLAQAVRERIGPSRVHPGHTLIGFENGADGVVAMVRRRTDEASLTMIGSALIGCDGIRSTVRRTINPTEGAPVTNGVLLWRGTAAWPAFGGGASMLVAGGCTAKFVCYPIARDPNRSDYRLTNWAVMAKVDGPVSAADRGDWQRLAHRNDVLTFIRRHFALQELDAEALAASTATIYEYPNCDRDPLPRWSHGRVTLLGDAAHPMYPVGSNGASQAIRDACSLARHMRACQSVEDALAAYETERRPATTAILLTNRQGGPERVIDLVDARAPDGFDDIERIASHSERHAIATGYAQLAGYARDQVDPSP